MVKTRNCLVKISNGPKSSDKTYVSDGRLAEGFQWPKTIKPGQERDVLNYELDWSLAGCSGYVTYNMFDTDITIAFSNPSVGVIKLGVGTGGKKVWEEMGSQGYNEFTVNIDASNERAKLQFDCKCTDGTTNTYTVNIRAYTN